MDGKEVQSLNIFSPMTELSIVIESIPVHPSNALTRTSETELGISIVVSPKHL